MKTRVADPALRREVEAAVRRRVRGDEAEDVVQATLADVLSARVVPEEPEEFRRFVFGVARNKVFDHFRRQKRQAGDLDDHEPAAPEPPLSARDILRWAEGELPDSEAQTLEWMLREGDGEKLEHIARDAQLPATRVRKRVSRLRKLFRDRWAAELLLAGLAALLCGLGVLYWYAKGKTPDDVVKREPVRPVPSVPREPAPSRPAGSAAPIPNLVAPPVAPTPSAAPSALPERTTSKLSKPVPTEDGRSFPAPIVTGKAPAPSLLNQKGLSDFEQDVPLDNAIDNTPPDNAVKSQPSPRKAEPAPAPQKAEPAPAPQKAEPAPAPQKAEPAPAPAPKPSAVKSKASKTPTRLDSDGFVIPQK